MGNKYSHINKNRKTGVNRSNLRMTKEKKIRIFKFSGVELIIKLNNCQGIIDIQPRIGDALNILAGRQWGLQENYIVLRDEISKQKNNGQK